MRAKEHVSILILCTITLCMQGCPAFINQVQNEYHQGIPNVIWLYSPADSVYLTSYCDVLTTPKKKKCYHAPDSCFAMQYVWECPGPNDPLTYDERYHTLHLRKLSNRDTAFVIIGDPNFYLNGVKCKFSLWIIPQYLYREADSLRTTYSFKQIIDSFRVHYPHRIDTILDTNEHIYDEIQMPNKEPLPSITIN